MIEHREYQSRTVEAVAAAWRAGLPRVVLVSPTGSGKTTMAAEIVRRAVANGKRVLFLAHRRRLIRQIADRAAEFGVHAGVVMADLPAGESWARSDPAAPLQIASRDTLLARTRRLGWDAAPRSDLLIVDECHNLEGELYSQLANACGVKFRVGLTATPCKPDGTGLGRANWDELVESATVPELTAAGFLVPVKSFAPPGVGERRRKGDKTPVVGDPVGHWRKYADGLPTVAFARTVAESIAVKDRYVRAGVPAVHIDGTTPDADRDRAADDLKSGRVLVVVNCNVWTEGVDVPELAACQLLCRCGSYVRFAQSVGRVMRPAPGKSHAVLLDHAGAVFEHGFPGDRSAWSLADDSVAARHKKERDDGERAEPLACRGCGFLFPAAAACPECGVPVPKKKQKPADPGLGRERLVQVDGAPGADGDRLQRLWVRCLRTAASMGRTAGTAAAMFRREAGDYPSRFGVTPSLGFEVRDRQVRDLLPHMAPKGGG